MSPAGSKNAPEAKAREKIDALLAQAGWLVQDRDDMNLTAGDGIAVREFKLEKGHGYVDYLLFVDGNAVGVVEAKPAGYSFTSVEVQAKKYVEGLPAALTAPHKPLPFAYISTGEETVFINHAGPAPALAPGLHVSPARDAAGVADGRHARRVAQAVRRLLHRRRRHQALHAAGATAGHAAGRAARPVAEQGAGHRRTWRRACSTTGHAP